MDPYRAAARTLINAPKTAEPHTVLSFAPSSMLHDVSRLEIVPIALPKRTEHGEKLTYAASVERPPTFSTE